MTGYLKYFFLQKSHFYTKIHKYLILSSVISNIVFLVRKYTKLEVMSKFGHVRHKIESQNAPKAIWFEESPFPECREYRWNKYILHSVYSSLRHQTGTNHLLLTAESLRKS